MSTKCDFGLGIRIQRKEITYQGAWHRIDLIDEHMPYIRNIGPRNVDGINYIPNFGFNIFNAKVQFSGQFLRYSVSVVGEIVIWNARLETVTFQGLRIGGFWLV